MCLVFVAWRAHPRYRLVVAANRDEYHARPTAPAAPWGPEPGSDDGEAAAARRVPPTAGSRESAARRIGAGAGDGAGDGAGAVPGRVLAGRDLQAGGTWLGVTANGRFGALTNVSGSTPPRSDAPSRGRLVLDHLRSGLDVRSHARAVDRDADRYSGFNLLLADRDGLFCITNRGGEGLHEVPAGCHGLGNDRLNAREPKVTAGLAEFRRMLSAEFATDDLFALLADDEPAATEGSKACSAVERGRTARFIRNSVYGTRSSTVLCIDRTGTVSFEERSFDAEGDETGRVAFECEHAGEGGFRLPAGEGTARRVAAHRCAGD